jgi:hypothetical protein
MGTPNGSGGSGGSSGSGTGGTGGSRKDGGVFAGGTLHVKKKSKIFANHITDGVAGSGLPGAGGMNGM